MSGGTYDRLIFSLEPQMELGRTGQCLPVKASRRAGRQAGRQADRRAGG
jgi:hypothetical protein